MDRYQELIDKRDGPGLSDEEADELGRLMAEREGRDYANADSPPVEVEAERVSKEPEEFLEEEEDSKEYRDVDDTVMTREGQPARDKDFPPPA
jgi:hypothetical protein